MNYITPYDINDKVLNVVDEDIVEAESYVRDVAQRKGVSVDKIVTPLPFKAKRLAVCFACYNNCLRNVGSDPTTTFDNGKRDDIYAQKLAFYKRELKEIEEAITPFDFTGVKAGGLTLELERG